MKLIRKERVKGKKQGTKDALIVLSDAQTICYIIIKVWEWFYIDTMAYRKLV